MDDDDLFDLLTEVEETVAQHAKAARFEAEASGVAVGEFGRASLLIAAGEHWQMRGEYDEARRCFEAARTDGGESASDPVSNLLSLALEEGDEDAVAARDTELRQMARVDAVSRTTCHLTGEAYEMRGRLAPALRWFSIPFTHAEPDADDPVDEMLLLARRRVRDALDKVPDRMDELVADQWQQWQRARTP
jgi:hypothetical protein